VAAPASAWRDVEHAAKLALTWQDSAIRNERVSAE